MNAAARGVVMELPDITIAYGVSDEYRYPKLIFKSFLVESCLTLNSQLRFPQDMHLV